MKDGED
jgi:hypothetical protein